MSILVTGGAGYIGTHTLVELLSNDYEVVVMDNFSNSSPKAIAVVEEMTGKKIRFYQADISSRADLEKIFDENPDIKEVINFASLKAVGESCEKPWEYYSNNIGGTLTLLDVMRKHGAKNFVFSSSATVYGDPAMIPSRSSVRKGYAQILTAGQNGCLNRYS